MSDYSIVPNAALTATADAIRTKTGSQATIEFDHNTGFKDAVDAIPSGGGGPDLSNDTVTAETLLYGETAHNASGQAITGTLEGNDFLKATLQITMAADSDTTVVMAYGIITQGSTSKTISGTGRTLSFDSETDTVYSYNIPSGSYTYISFGYSSSKPPLAFSNLSSGVTVMNGGEPVTASGTTKVYMVRINGSTSATRSFTVSKVHET